MNLKNKQNKGKRKTIYISGPITGVDDYLIKFSRAEMYLALKIATGDLAYTGFINPAFTNRTLPNDFEHQDYMAVCFALMDLCDGIYLFEVEIQVDKMIDYKLERQWERMKHEKN